MPLPEKPRTITSLSRKLLFVFIILACIVPVREGFPSEQGSVLVGFAQDTLANDWRLAQVQGVEQAFSAYPHIRFVYTDGKGSTSKQIRDIEDMINRGVDILITSPRDSRAMTPVISRAYRQGIPVILLTRKIETSDYTTFIAPDDAAIARDAAAFMAAEMQGQGRIFMLQGLPSASTAILRTNAFLDELRHHEGVDISVIKTANYLRSDAIKAVEEVLQQDIPFDAIYAQSDSMASGARIALKKAGVDLKNTVIVGIDYISEARTAIRNGEQRASYIYPTCAREAVEAAVTLSRGEKVARAIKVPSQRVTKDNVDKIDPIF